ncbi:mycofactocin-coupled SDR family oxidoreductase [Streptomyces sp. NBC_01808]|uniref:mycofactocin-coupled SDR family oxidoreductase n=1 Tax=Streptomyces sp. NBC_01808 TaxID=2975947 RepID=UPI002DDBEA4D|nr:mycofactocin-coupled SDR family oxidoreductase [Streptomyces sp. NBC_01808]WSA38359.1 mycofactocin-coupled SDR family oxidoreductase [Streptomyces sp. NBC_01808]
MYRLEGRVAFITGIGRGQGRNQAVRLASEGADIIGVDICRDVESAAYSMASEDDMAETVRQVEALGRRVVARVGDVRDGASLRKAVQEGVEQFGRLDFVVANAGISTAQFGMTTPEQEEQAWNDAIAVNLTGAWNTAQAAIPYMVAGGRGGSIVFIGSTAGLRGLGAGGYTAAKHGVVGIMRGLANELAEDNIRVNVVHPAAVNTPMAVNEGMQAYVDAQAEKGAGHQNAMPLLEPADISAAVAFLLSDEARYITGTDLPVDAGFVNRVS